VEAIGPVWSGGRPPSGDEDARTAGTRTTWGVAMWVQVGATLLASLLHADGAPSALKDLFPGRWVPAQIGVVREHDPARDRWDEPRIQVVLRWQPEDPDRLRWLSEAACAEAAYWACARYGVIAGSLITDGGPVPCTGLTTVTSYGGAPEVRALFALPQTSPGQVDVCVQQAIPRAEPETFAVVADVHAAPPAEWATGSVSWKLGEVAADTWPPAPRPPIAPDGFRRERSTTVSHSSTTRSMRLTLAGVPTAPMLLHDLYVGTAALTSGEQEWPALQITLAHVSDTSRPADQPIQPASERGGEPAAPLQLTLWFPVERVPADAQLRIGGSCIRTAVGETPDDPSVERVYSDVPLPGLPL